jgi:transposase
MSKANYENLVFIISSIILDNARIHHYNKVKQFAITNNITLLFNTLNKKYNYL